MIITTTADMVLQHYKKRGIEWQIQDFARLRDPSFKIWDPDLKNLRVQDAKVSENETSRPITNASEISRTGQKFLGPAFFTEPLYIP